MAAGERYSLGLKANGSIVGWGSKDFRLPQGPASNEGFDGIVAGYENALGLRSSPRSAVKPLGPGSTEIPAGLAIRSLVPNPVRTQVELAFVAALAEPVTLEVFTVSGRQVGIVPLGQTATGLNRVRWNGAVGGGEPELSSGVYFLRLRGAGAVSPACKVELIR